MRVSRSIGDGDRVAQMPSTGFRIRHREAASQGQGLAICMMAFLKGRSRRGEEEGERKVRRTGEKVERLPLFTFLF